MRTDITVKEFIMWPVQGFKVIYIFNVCIFKDTSDTFVKFKRSRFNPDFKPF